MVWYSHLLKNFPRFIVVHTVKGFGRVNETEFDVSSSFSKPSLDLWKFLVHTMLKPSVQEFKYELTSMGDECNCLMVSMFFTTLLENGNED